MKLPPNFKLYVRRTIVACVGLVILTVGSGAYVWFTYHEKIGELQDKDPDRFQEMIDAGSELRFGQARDLFQVIDAMTPAEVYRLRYDKWNAKWQEDAEFREAHLQARSDTHDQTKADRQGQYKVQNDRLNQLKVRTISMRQAEWKSKTPWEQGIMLRENCSRFLRRAQSPARLEHEVNPPDPNGFFLAENRVVGQAPSQHCDEMVSLGDSPESVQRSLERLKRGMNYYSFRQMSDAIGLPEATLHSLEDRLVKMTDDF